MATVVLFHHVLGLTQGVLSFADALRAAGHSVTTPDLFEGQTFTDLSSGLAQVGEIGDDELLRRAQEACADLPANLVFAGLSLGVVPAQHLLHTRPGAAGAVFLHAFIAPDQLPGSWPNSCPVEVYATQQDPFFVGDGDLAAARAWQESHSNLQIHLYPGEGHLFMEPGFPDYDPALTRQVTEDVIASLAAMEPKL